MVRQITAHSGCDDTVQNSLEYVKHAVSTKADAVEIDVRKLPDGQMVLTHNESDSDSLVSLKTAFEIILASGKMVNCDLKEYNLEDDVLAVAKEVGLSTDKLVLSGSVTNPSEHVKKYPMLKAYINAEEVLPGFYDNLEKDKLIVSCLAYGFDVLNINYKVLDDEFINKCNKAGLKISAWTINDVSIIDNYFDKGLFNITTNRITEYYNK